MSWSREAKRKLTERKGLRDDAAEHWVGYLQSNFPTGRINIEAALTDWRIASLTVDPEDLHVCALAIGGHAAYLFTHDRGYLREAIRGFGVEVVRPDEFLTASFSEQPDAMMELLSRQASEWAGGRPLTELLAALERAGAGQLVASVRRRPEED